MSSPVDLAQTVKQQADIVRVVGDYVQLKKAGAQNFSGLCPFHQEKTASFSVHATRQFFHCFGCGASGDIFTFVQKIENISFPEAIRLSLAAPLLHGLELWGPYMFLIMSVIAATVAVGLLRLNNVARRVAAMIALAGIIMLIPKVSADTAYFSLRFFLSGSMIVVRAMIVWYLWQSRTVEHFQKSLAG